MGFEGRGWGTQREEIKRTILKKCLNTFVPHCGLRWFQRLDAIQTESLFLLLDQEEDKRRLCSQGDRISSRNAIETHLFAPRKGIQDSLGFWIPRRGFRIPGTGFQSLSAELGIWIPIVSGIPDSLSCMPEFQSPGLRISKAKTSRIPESGFPYLGRHLYFTWMTVAAEFLFGSQDSFASLFKCERTK